MLVVAVGTTSLICHPEEYKRNIAPHCFLSYLILYYIILSPHHLSVTQKNTKEKYPPLYCFFLEEKHLVFFLHCFLLEEEHLSFSSSEETSLCWVFQNRRKTFTLNPSFVPMFQDISLNLEVWLCLAPWSGHLGLIPVNFWKKHMLCKATLIIPAVKLLRVFLANCV